MARRTDRLISLRLSRDLHDRLAARADELGEPNSVVIRNALRRELARERRQQKEQ